jgi:hypothetical protein
VGNWLKSFLAGLLQDEVKRIITLGVGAAFAGQGAILWAYGWDFLTAAHPIRGWVILSAVGIVVLFLSSVTLNVVQWLRARRRTFAIVAEGHPSALHWGMGSQGEKPMMMVVGDFIISNLSPYDLLVPRTELIVSYRLWRVVPRRKRVVGVAGIGRLKSHHQGRERLMWMLQPPLLRKGQPMRARPVLIDSLNRVSKGDWHVWP